MKTTIRERVIKLLASMQGKPVPQSYIHRALNTSKSRISEVLNQLEKEGLITRTNIGRSNIVYVKPGLVETETRVESRILRLGIVYSSEYLFLGYFVKFLQRKYGIHVNVEVYRDGFDTTRAITNGQVDLVLSPLAGQLYLYPAYRTFKIINSGLKGGYSILYKPGRSEVYSSMLSTMDYIRHLLLKEKLIDAHKTIYYKNHFELEKLTGSGGYIVTWHPVYMNLAKKNYKIILTHRDIDIGFCCTLAISSIINRDLVDSIKEAFTSALESYEKSPEKMLNYYSSITGIDISILKNAVKEYTPVIQIDEKDIANLTTATSYNLPERSIYMEAIYE